MHSVVSVVSGNAILSLIISLFLPLLLNDIVCCNLNSWCIVKYKHSLLMQILAYLTHKLVFFSCAHWKERFKDNYFLYYLLKLMRTSSDFRIKQKLI